MESFSNLALECGKFSILFFGECKWGTSASISLIFAGDSDYASLNLKLWYTIEDNALCNLWNLGGFCHSILKGLCLNLGFLIQIARLLGSCICACLIVP